MRSNPDFARIRKFLQLGPISVSVAAGLVLLSTMSFGQNRLIPREYTFAQNGVGGSGGDQGGSQSGWQGQSGGRGFGNSGRANEQAAMAACATSLGITLPSQGSNNSSSSGSTGTSASAVTPAQWEQLAQCVRQQANEDQACVQPVKQAQNTLNQCLMAWRQVASQPSQAIPSDQCTSELTAFTTAVQTAQTCVQQAAAGAGSSSSSSSSSSGSN